jgi:hypothetical protein
MCAGCATPWRCSSGPRRRRRRARRSELQAEIANLADAIASGLLRTSPALADRLARAEQELAALQAAPAPIDASNIIELLPRVLEKFRALAANLGRLARHDVVRARTEIRKLLGDVTLQRDGNVLVAEINKAHVAGALLAAAGARQQMVMVAGERFQISEPPQSRFELSCGVTE